MLAERAGVIAELAGLLTTAREGNGILAVINGPPATGKSSLLRAVAEQAQASGAQVLMVACSRAEADHPYALLDQLTELPAARPRAAAAPPASRPGAGGEPAAAARDVHRLVMDLARDGTVLIGVDDVQYADDQSLRSLQYLVRRLLSLPVMVVLTRGTQAGQPLRPLHAELLHRSDARQFHLEPLSAEGVAQLVAEHSEEAARPAVVAEYHQLTGGNPLLVQALLGARGQPREAAFGQAVVACLHTMGPQAVRVARAAAVLGGPVDSRRLGQLSGTGPELTDRIVRALTTVGILDQGRFRHPVSQPAILEDMPAEEAVELRYRAAALLHDDGEPLQRVARHLLAAGASRSAWAVTVLRQAARQGLLNGDIWLAIRYLELAAECCTEPGQAELVKVQLADIYWHVRLAASAQRYQSLKAAMLAGVLPPGQALRAVPRMLWHLQMDDAAEVLNHVMGDEAARAGVAYADIRHTELLTASCFPGIRDRLRLPFPPGPPADGAAAAPPDTAEAQASRTLSAVLARTANRYTLAQAEQAVRASEVPLSAFRAVALAVMSLVYSDRLDVASAWCERMMTRVDAYEASTCKAMICGRSALVLLRRGLLKQAAERAELALDHLADQGWCAELGMIIATLIEAHTAMGDHAAAARYVSRPVPPALFDTRSGLHYLYARGQHHLATGSEHAALADFTACGERMARWNMDTPALVPWRAGAVEALLRLGDTDRAARLAEEQMERLGEGLGRAAGISLRCLAAVRDRGKRPAILNKALHHLRDSGDSYEIARALTDLSAAYNALGVRAEARTMARRAWRLAKSCGAEELCERAQPTQAAPDKAREQEAVTGEPGPLARLSDSERRVALLASAGYTNRDISSRLFITVSTVEQHLTRVYRKMDIKGRDELPIGLNNGLTRPGLQDTGQPAPTGAD